MAEFITPKDAVSRLLRVHYPGTKKGNARRVRMALIGGLRSGCIDWKCNRWIEKYTSDSGADYDENGGYTTEEPKFGWPADFWTPALAADNEPWESNYFLSRGVVTLLSAPLKVRRWLQSNNEATAIWVRGADDVFICWEHIEEQLGGAGWQVWAAEAHQVKAPPLRSRHYNAALIDLLAIAVRNPSAEWDRSSIMSRLFDAFETNGASPDVAELKRLTKWISEALEAQEMDDAPIE